MKGKGGAKFFRWRLSGRSTHSVIVSAMRRGRVASATQAHVIPNGNGNCIVSLTLAQTLLSYGAQSDQRAQLAGSSPRTLRYTDLKNGDATWSPPVVAEHEHVPRVFVFDGRTKSGELSSRFDPNQRCRRILLRGDPAWTAILRAGRLDVLSFEIQGKDVVTSKESIAPGSGGLTRFIHDVRSGAAGLTPTRVPQRSSLRIDATGR